MKHNSFVISEFKSIYYKKDNEFFGFDINENLVVTKKVFEEIKQIKNTCAIMKM